jgi:deoxyribose-phosphate aldolase
MDMGEKRSGKISVTARDIAKMIDHSLLNPTMTIQQIIDGCNIAKEYDVATVCVKPSEVLIAKEVLKGTDVLVTTVVGFPHGASTTEAKVFEAKQSIIDGAVELDMVLNIGRLLSRDFEYVEKDIKAVVDAAHVKGVIVKVIFENCYLTDELKEVACRLCEKAGADFVKTSTGYGTGGATMEDLRLMTKTCSEKVRVKAAGGVRTLDAALAVRSIGTVRFGATATKAIMDEAYKREAEGNLFMDDEGELKGGY